MSIKSACKRPYNFRLSLLLVMKQTIPKSRRKGLQPAEVTPDEKTKVAHQLPMNGTLFNSAHVCVSSDVKLGKEIRFSKFINLYGCEVGDEDRKSTRLNSSHPSISYA